MSSEEDYESDYDTRPEAGRPKKHLDSDESDNERSSSGPRRPLRFLNDDYDDDYDDDTPMIVEETQQERSASASAPTATTATVNPIRQPTAFAAAAAAPNLANTSPGSAFYKTPIHAAVSRDGTSMFCVEGYVNTPELSAGRGGGLSQGLPANGPYKSLFRARSESRGSNIASATATAIAPDAALHVLADAAQSPEALSPISVVSTASPAPAQTPAPASKHHRKPSPLAASSPSSSVAPLDSTSTAQPSPAASSINANPSSSQSHTIIDASHHPRPRLTQTKSRGGGGGSGGSTGKGKQKEKVTSRPSARADGNGERVYEGHSFLRPQSGPLIPAAEPRETESMAQFRLRNVQKNRADSKGVASVLPPAPTPANDGSYHHAGGYYPSYIEAGSSDSSNIVAHTVRETWESPGLSSPGVNDYPASARTTSKESSPTADSRSLTPGTKPRMLTLLIEDRRHGTDELVEVHVPVKPMGEGYLWADAKDVSAALQSGPSRIDGPAKVLTMRGKYRQTFLRVSAEGEETSQSANLKVETDRTLSIIVEGIPDPRVVNSAPFLSSNPSPLVTTGLAGPVLNMEHPLTPVSNDLGLDRFHTTPLDHMEVGQRPDGARKRKRETSLSHIQRLPFDSPESRSFTNTVESATARTMTPHEHHTRPWKSRRSDPISPFDGGYMSDSPPVAYRGHKRAHRKGQVASGSHMYHSGYETDQPLPSVRARVSSGIMAAPEQHQGSDRRVSSLLQPPPTCMEGSQRMYDKVVSFLRDNFMEDASHWNEFTRDRAHVGSLSNVALLRVYWFAQERLNNWIGSRLPKHLTYYKKVEMRHVLDALGVTEDWYRECNETLSLVVAFGERGKRYENPRAVAASRDRAPKSHAASSGPTDLLLLLRQVHEEYCERVRGRIG